MTVTVFSKPKCPQCDATYRKLKKLGIEYESRDVTEEPEAEARVRELGYQQVPVVETEDGDHWYGYRPDKLEEIVKKQHQTC